MRGNQIVGHCWILAPSVPDLGGFQAAGNHEAIVSRTLKIEPKV
jgi:hypothetical protein